MALAHLAVAMCVSISLQRSAAVHRQRGFTLIEVMIAVAIVGILAMVAVPNYLQWNARYQLKQATTELAGSLNLARMAAMNRNLAVTATLVLVSGRVNVDFGGALAPIVLPQAVVGFTGGPTIQFTQQGRGCGECSCGADVPTGDHLFRGRHSGRQGELVCACDVPIEAQ